MDKSQEDFNFRHHCRYNVDEIKKHIFNFSNEWLIDTSRQDNYYMHNNTESYFIYKSSIKWNKNSSLPVEVKTNDIKLKELIEPIVKDLEVLHNGTRANVLFIKLKANSDVKGHRDSGEYLLTARRHHIPIVTSDNTLFSVGLEKINMKVGECWEINNARFHSVENGSNIDRVHLLIDIMPNKELGK